MRFGFFTSGLLSSVLLATCKLISAAPILPHAVPSSAVIDRVFPLRAYNREYAARGGNAQPSSGRLLMYLPPQFHPDGTWPLLIVSSTSDGGRTSTMDAPYYRATATAEGWVVLATDATIRPRTDTTVWRVAVLSAALQVLHREWPASKSWPVVFAGMSGGAKRSELVSAIFADTGSLRIAGLFLAGINHDLMNEALHDFPPPREFFETPVWISGGSNDPIATPALENDVRGSLLHLGFRPVKLSTSTAATS